MKLGSGGELKSVSDAEIVQEEYEKLGSVGS